MSNSKSKVSTIVSLILLNFILYIIYNTSPVTGYELSIYDAYPSYFFVAVIVSFSCSCFGLLNAIQAGSKGKMDISCIANIFVICMLGGILLLLPLFRGYAFYDRHDPLTHLGSIKDILQSGHLGTDNFYPTLHIFSSTIIQITNLYNFFLIREVIPPTLYVYFILCICILVKEISKNNRRSLFAFLFASIPILGGALITFTPSDTLFFTVPLIVYLLYLDVRLHSAETKVLLILTVISIPYAHPEIVVFSILSFLLFVVILWFFNHGGTTKESMSLNLPLILFISFFIWFSSFSQFFLYSKRLYLWFFERIGEIPIDRYSALLSRAQLPLSDLIELIFKREGALIIYFALAFSITLVVLRDLLLKRKVDVNQVFFGTLFLLTMLSAAFSLFNYTIIDFGRILKYAIFSSMVLIGIFLAQCNITHVFVLKTSKFTNFRSKFKRRMIQIFIFLILIIAMMISTFNLHPSPLIESYNPQVTAMEIKGSNWLVEFGDRGVEPVDMFLTFGRFVHAYEGYSFSMEEDKSYASALYSINRMPPDHFNYTFHNSLGESYSQDKYLLTNKLMKLYYFELWPKHARFTQDDFIKLSSDPTVDAIYSNGEFQIYHVHGMSY